jgi:hypothetical protein
MISILTAAGRLEASHLADAYKSLLAQGHDDWEWVIQLDGEQLRLPTHS